MPDAFLDSTLSLDIRAALQQVDRLNAELARATTDIRVTADVRSVTAAIDAAVDAADSLLQIAVDTSGVTQEITGAVDAADTGVVVTGDASEITGSIDGAVDAADTAVVVTATATDVTASIDGAVDAADTTVTVDGQVNPGLRADVVSLDASLDDAAESGSRLGTILAGIGVVGVVAAVRALADAASDLQESTSKAGVVFGEQFADIQQFADSAATSTGLANQEALEATATFGNLFQALGTSREEAARLSPEVVQLAADLASFNNIGVDEALEKLRSGLVGEVEPLRSLGVSFLAADVQAKALELGLGDLNGTLTEGEKVQARLALITEQTTLAQGDFARTADGLANQQRILQAEMRNAAATAGTALLPALLALVTEVRENVPAFGEFAGTVLPAVSDAMVNLAPLIGTTVDLLVLLAPAMAAVAQVFASIPPEVISLGATMLIANKAIGGMTSLFGGLGGALRLVPQLLAGTAQATKTASEGVGPLARGVTSLASSLGALSIPAAAAVAVGAALFREWQEGRRIAAEHKAAVDAVSASLAGVGEEYADAEVALESYVSGLVEAETAIAGLDGALSGFSAGEVFRTLGLDASSAADLIASGAPAVAEFESSLGDLTDAERLALFQLRELTSQTDDAVKAQLRAREATGQLTVAEEQQLAALDRRGAGTEAYIALLDESAERQAIAAREAEALITIYDEQAAAIVGAGDALTSLAEESPTAAAAVESIRQAGLGSDEALLAFTTTLDGAALSEQAMADAAIALGTDVETLSGFITDAQAVLQGFVDTAVSGLPSIADAFRDANDDSQVSAREFIDGLAEDTLSIVTFMDNLAVIVGEGFAEVAGVLADKGVEAAGVVAQELADAARAGNNALLEETQAGLDARDFAIQASTTYLRETLGPEYIAATGQVGVLATEAFGEGFDPAEEARISMQIAGSALTEEGKKVAAIAAYEGAEEARRYGEALNLDSQVITEAVRAGVAIRTNSPTAAFYAAGDTGGKAYGDGFADGLTSREARVYEKAYQLGASAKAAMDRSLRNSSPSREMFQRGVWFGEGLALGIEDTTSLVVAEAEDLARAAAHAASAAVKVDPVGLTTSAANAAAATASQSGGMAVTFAAGSVVVQAPEGMTRAEAEEVGEGIVDGMERRLVERDLFTLARST